MRTVGGILALGVAFAVSATPAWSGTTCPAGQVPSASASPGGECGEEAGEAELERQEDEEEEVAIAAERAAAGARDGAEEAAEEAGELADGKTGTGGSVSHSSKPGTRVKLALRVRVLAIRRHLRAHPAETRIAVWSNVPARVRVRVRDSRGVATLYTGESNAGRRYFARVLWGCLGPARRYTFTVTAYALGERDVGAEDIVVRRRAFTLDGPRVCGPR